MGMAASQARFLGLTARKSNTEYEGQQINQQRTSLANQSANYYNQLLGMTVPTPPSSSDFTKTVYTFADGNLSNSITALIAKPDGEYLVSYISSWVDEYTPVSAGSAIVTRSLVSQDPEVYNYRVGSTLLRTFDGSAPTAAFIAQDEYLSTLSEEQLSNLFREEAEYKTMLDEQYGQQNWCIRYVKNTTTNTYEPVFYKESAIINATYSETGTSQSNIQAFRMGSAQRTEEIKGVTARLEKDSTGRYINITLHSDDPTRAVTYSLTTNTTTDQNAYDDAMNQYEYDKYQYDQSIQEINAKIEIIQSQDKNLELRLKQLDTERNAIQTEMEAVQKVIQKNTEDSFKTFNA